MNDETNRTTPPALPTNPPPEDATVATGNIVTRLLKSPSSVALTIKNNENLVAEAVKMLGAALLCHAVFGLAAGLFGGWEVALTAVWKAPFIALCAMLLCLPSLYVFAAVLGSPMNAAQALAFASACFATTGLIMVALAPVAWLFAVSTESLVFVVVMVFIMWLVALGFTAKFLACVKGAGLLKKHAGLRLWFVILILVSLQMTTVMRPILSAPKEDGRAAPGEKMFFLQHLGKTFETAFKQSR